MSDVKICDKRSGGCGRIFSVQSNGWTTMSGTQMVRNPATGRMEARQAEQDRCGPCNGVPEEEGTYALGFGDHVRELEAAQSEAEMWRAKFEAEKARTQTG